MTEDEEIENTYRLMKKETDFQKVQKYIERQTEIAIDEARKSTRIKSLQEKGWTEDEYYHAFGKDYIQSSNYYSGPSVTGWDKTIPCWWQFWKMIKINRNGF